MTSSVRPVRSMSFFPPSPQAAIVNILDISMATPIAVLKIFFIRNLLKYKKFHNFFCFRTTMLPHKQPFVNIKLKTYLKFIDIFISYLQIYVINISLCENLFDKKNQKTYNDGNPTHLRGGISWSNRSANRCTRRSNNTCTI